MKLAPRVWVLAGLLLLAAAGLFAPGLAGSLGIYAWLGVFPGLALTRVLLPRCSATTRGTIGLVLSPLVSAVAGWASLRAGLDLVGGARLIAVAGWIAFAGGEARAVSVSAEVDGSAPMSRFAWIWLAVTVLFAALPPLVNPWILIRSDTWVHGALVNEIRLHGIPPMDPRFVGLRLNYVWIYHLFIAQLASLRGQDPFVFMAILNAVTIGVMIALVWQLAWILWDDDRAAHGTLALFTLGLNAAAWLLWPLNLARAFTGEVRGIAEVRRILADSHPGSTDVIYLLAAPYAHMVQFWDKVTLGNPLGYAYAFLLLHWWAFARMLRGDGARWLVIAFLAASGSVLFHSVVALGMVPVTLGACVVALFARGRFGMRLPTRPTLAFLAATLLGSAVALPYLVSVASGWRGSSSGLGHHWLEIGWRMPWTIATACGVLLVFAVMGLRAALAQGRAAVVWLAVWAFGMATLACLAHLPESNEHKFVWPLAAALALVGGASFLPGLAAWRARWGTPAFAVAFALVFLVPPLAFLQGYVRDPMRNKAEALQPLPGESALWAWMREHTSPDDVVIDNHSRDLALVLGERRMLAGTPFGPERAAFPVADLARRRAVTDDLYGPLAHLDDDLAALREVVTHARSLERVGELLVVYRDADGGEGEPPWRRLEAAAGARARAVYDAGGFHVTALDVGAR